MLTLLGMPRVKMNGEQNLKYTFVIFVPLQMLMMILQIQKGTPRKEHL